MSWDLRSVDSRRPDVRPAANRLLDDDPTPPAATSAGRQGGGRGVRFPDLHGDQHDVQELLVSPAVDDDVDGRVDDEREVVDVHQGLDPVGPVLDFAVEKELDKIVTI